ncbi:hypothetical protein B0A52_03543 [Exophiala mesophila]|uniref:alpha-glucosidase n=1 Tax=Exophiala mesophila TaxID=212818 RepID=A0A438N603_EXOME|nr:hypothetical protein B0A52_03543 [Exophiala mesophila]
MPQQVSETTSHKKSAIIGGPRNYRFTVLTDGLIRYEWAPDGIFEDRPSTFAVHRDLPTPDFSVKDTDGNLEIITSRFHLTYNKEEFTPYGLSAVVFKHTQLCWRFGQDQDYAEYNLGGTYRTLDRVDGRVSMGHGILSRLGFASLDDSKSLLFEKNGFVAPRRPGPNRIDGYLFAYGHDYREAVKALYAVSGSQPLLPRWALGNWWSRYYAYTAESYLDLVDNFEKIGVPLSAAVIDMDWHLVDDPRIKKAGQSGWTGYTWNKKLFPNPPAFIEELHERHLRVTLNEHPAEGIHSYEDLYEKVAKALHVPTDKGQPIPFDIANPDFLKVYFDVLISSLEDDGVDFWWIDWQQGQFSRMKDADPLWLLNHYHFQHNTQRFPDRHALIFSRYAGPGSHRYPIGFSGDTVVSWASLEFQPEFTNTASNIGYGWWSHDIGGHMLGVKDEELLVRWIQYGVFSPILRLHSTKNRWVSKEPWKLPRLAGDIVSNYLRLRHRLIPYIHTMNARAAIEGAPLIQPLYWEHPGRDEAYRHKNHYYFGSQLICFPITSPQDRQLRLAKTKAWLPPGRYVDFFTGFSYEGDTELWLSRPLDQYPLFLRAGSIVPLDCAVKPSNGAGNPEGFEILIAVGADGTFEVMEEHDESQGKAAGEVDWDRILITYTQATGTVEIHPKNETGRDLALEDHSLSLRFVGLSDSISIAPTATVHITKYSYSITSSNPPMLAYTPTTTSHDHPVKVIPVSNGILLDLGEVSALADVVVKLGIEDPKLDLYDNQRALTNLIEPIIRDAQIEYAHKDAIWAVVANAHDHKGTSKSVMLKQLEALDHVNENLKIAVAEYLE